MACISKRRGRYVIDCYDQNGKRYRKSMKAGITKEAARKELHEVEMKIEKRTFIYEKNAPLFSEVASQWLEYKKFYLRETTWELSQGHTRVHFADLDNLRINQITTPTIEKWITTKQTGGININTLRRVLVTLNQILKYSVRHRYLDSNPARDAERPTDKGKEVKDKIRILTPAQIQALIEKLDSQKYRTLILLAIMTGARCGELLGLKWSDLDMVNNQIRIQRTFNGGRFFDTKTKGSKRNIDLSPKIMLELKKWKLACPPNDLDLVFPNEAGQPINYCNMVQRYYQKALRASGCPKIRFHDLRHTYASLLIEQGENIKYIQTQLGHSSPTVTLSVYAHLMKPVNQEAAIRLENNIFQTTGHNLVTNKKMELTING